MSQNGIHLIRSNTMKCLLDNSIKNTFSSKVNSDTGPKILYERNEKEGVIQALDDFSLLKVSQTRQDKKYNGSNRFVSPVIIRWDIAYKCNFKCIHCYSECSPEDEKGLNTQEVKKMIDIFDSSGVQFVQILGGEPFMREDIFEIIEYATKKKFIFAINTNGFLLSEKSIIRLNEIGLKYIQVSLHGLENEHNKLAGTISFKRIVRNIQLLIKYGIQVSVACLVSDINSRTIMDYIRFLEGIGVENIQLLTPLNQGRAINEGITLNQDESELLKRELILYKNSHPHLNLDFPGFDIDLIDGLVNENLGNPEFEFIYGCIGGVTGMRVNPQGKACICVGKVDMPIGDILHEPMEDIMKKMYQWRKNNIPKRCTGCEHYLNECQGACYLRF